MSANVWLKSGLALAAFVLIAAAPAARADDVPLSESDGLQIYRVESPPKLVIMANASAVDVIDGDTIWLSIFKIRLKGIDTVEVKQSCRLDGDIQCAEQVRRELATLLEGVVRCEVQFDPKGYPAMNHSRYVATCFVGSNEINSALVESGWAFADEKGSVPAYVEAQEAARAKELGVHRYVHEKPWDFRRRTRTAKHSDFAEAPCPQGRKRVCP